jgi:hypothetical protein
MYGEPWKKPTKILYHNFDLSSVSRLCHGTAAHCSFSNRPHIALKGTDKHGVFLTLKAQPYPWALAHEISRVVANTLRDSG